MARGSERPWPTTTQIERMYLKLAQAAYTTILGDRTSLTRRFAGLNSVDNI